MEGFNPAWFIAGALGVILLAIDILIPERHRKRIGWAPLTFGLALLCAGLIGVGSDLYKKFTKPETLRSQSEPQKMTTGGDGVQQSLPSPSHPQSSKNTSAKKADSSNININAPISQTSNAPNSPNIIGNNNQVTIGTPLVPPPPARTLSPQQMEMLTKVASMSPAKINILAENDEPDAWKLAKQVADALKSARWTIGTVASATMGKYDPDKPDAYGISVQYKGEKLEPGQKIYPRLQTGWGVLLIGLTDAGLEEITVNPGPNVDEGVVYLWICKNPKWSNRPKP